METEDSLPCSQGPLLVPILSTNTSLCVIFRNKLFFTVRSVSPSSKPQAGAPPLVVCPRRLIQYIRSSRPSASVPYSSPALNAFGVTICKFLNFIGTKYFRLGLKPFLHSFFSFTGDSSVVPVTLIGLKSYECHFSWNSNLRTLHLFFDLPVILSLLGIWFKSLLVIYILQLLSLFNEENVGLSNYLHNRNIYTQNE